MTLLLTAKENKIDPVKYVAALLFYEKERKVGSKIAAPTPYDLMADDNPALEKNFRNLA